MVFRGRIEKGVVVLDEDVSLPEGTEVTVVVRSAPEPRGKTTAEAQNRRLVDTFQRIASLPIEGAPEPFSGADHDKVLYGKR
jgi:hypothetical protein